MKLNSLKANLKASKRKKRVGRGLGSGHGVTAGRGTKGQKARSGRGKGPSYEGGQTPLQRRLPRYPGFKNPFKKEIIPVNLEKLNIFEDGTVVDAKLLTKKGLVKKKNKLIKILAKGELKKKLTVKAYAFSKKAQEKIEALGGKVEVVK